MQTHAMIGDQERGVTAQTILTIRSLRKATFPSELFDEYAWNMLLILFVGLAANEVVSENHLIACAGAGVAPGRRWLNHLIKDGHISDRQDGDDVILTASAISQLRKFLDQARAADQSRLWPAT